MRMTDSEFNKFMARNPETKQDKINKLIERTAEKNLLSIDSNADNYYLDFMLMGTNEDGKSLMFKHQELRFYQVFPIHYFEDILSRDD